MLKKMEEATLELVSLILKQPNSLLRNRNLFAFTICIRHIVSKSNTIQVITQQLMIDLLLSWTQISGPVSIWISKILTKLNHRCWPFYLVNFNKELIFYQSWKPTTLSPKRASTTIHPSWNLWMPMSWEDSSCNNKNGR